MRVFYRCGQYGESHDHGEYPDKNADAFGVVGVSPLTRGLDLHNGHVAVNTDASQEQNTTVHVHKVREAVNKVAGVAGLYVVVHDYSCRQRQAHQEVCYHQVDGVDNRGGLGFGSEAEDIDGQTV